MSRTVDLASQCQAERHGSEVTKLLIGIKQGSNSVAIKAFNCKDSEDLLSMARLAFRRS